MKNNITWISILIGVIMLTRACGQMQVDVKVLDEDGQAIADAEVEVVYISRTSDEIVKKETDEQGIFKSRGTADLRAIAYVKKEGYYSYKSDKLSRLENHSLEVILRKIVNPIPLYAKKIQLQVPEINKEIGFDLKLSDWVSPFGEGKVSDFVVYAEKEYKDGNNFSTKVKIKFSRDYEGLAEDRFNSSIISKTSNFKTSRKSPLENIYKKENLFISQLDSENYRKGSTENKNYVFRTRTVLDENGNLKSCHYGKMTNAVDVNKWAGRPNERPIISFTYYFNPTPNDRNLEFDTANNLFKNLSWEEEVREP